MTTSKPASRFIRVSPLSWLLSGEFSVGSVCYGNVTGLSELVECWKMLEGQDLCELDLGRGLSGWASRQMKKGSACRRCPFPRPPGDERFPRLLPGVKGCSTGKRSTPCC